MRSGFAAVTKAKKDFEEQKESWDSQRTRDLRLVGDGAKAVLWFIGSEPEEPRETLVHTVSPGRNKFFYEPCAKGHKDHDGCVYCHAVKANDRRTKRPSKNFYFSIADTRWVHKTKNDERSEKAGRDVFDWADCPRTDDEPNTPCKLCKRKVPRERRGKCKLRLGLTVAIGLNNLNESLKKRCTSCNTGKISIVGYRKGKKVIPDLEDLDEEEQAGWEAEYECSKCDKPSPGSIFAAPITMMRNGTGQATTYVFTREDEFQDPPEWVQELEPLDWDKVLKPRSAENQAKLLDIDNPFEEGAQPRKRNKSAADEYDEDEDAFGDDDDEEEPKKSKPKGDDDEDDEGDE